MTPTQPCRCFGTIAGAAFALATSYLAGAQTTPTTPPTKEEVIQLSEFMVSAAADRGYATANTAGATRVNIAIKNTPLSVVPLNAEFLQDTGALTVAQAARYVSGVAFAGTPIVSQLTVRGQNTPGAVFRDGVPDAIQIRGGTPNDTALVERVEVIKGPAGTLYGSHNSGGIVNTITKAPSAIARHQVRAIADDFGTYRGELDSQGPLALKGASYRVVLAAQQGETAQGTKNDATIVSPMMMFVRPSGLRLLARYAYQHIDIGANSYPWFTDSLGQVSTFIPRRRMISENDVSRDTEIHFVDLEAEQRFSTAAIDWSVLCQVSCCPVIGLPFRSRTLAVAIADAPTRSAAGRITWTEAGAGGSVTPDLSLQPVNAAKPAIKARTMGARFIGSSSGDVMEVAEWALRDLNPRPPACKAGALNQLS